MTSRAARYVVDFIGGRNSGTSSVFNVYDDHIGGGRWEDKGGVELVIVVVFTLRTGPISAQTPF